MGALFKSEDEPRAPRFVPDWRESLIRAQAAARCGAKTRSGCPCKGPAMPNGRCRMHGGGSRGPTTAEGLARSKVSTLTHGRHSAAYIAERRAMAAQTREMRATTKRAKADLRGLWKLARLVRLYG